MVSGLVSCLIEPLAYRFEDLTDSSIRERMNDCVFSSFVYLPSKNKRVGIAIGRVGCLRSIGIFTDDDNDLINSSLRLVGLMDTGGDKLRFRSVATGECLTGIKSLNDNVCGF